MSNDNFDDVRHEVDRMGYGTLGGEGAEHHNSVKTKIVDEGVSSQLRCDHCGRMLVVTAPWTELIIMSQGALPPNNSWKHDAHNGCFLPNATCPHCKDEIRLGITPDECGRHLKSGVAAGKITGQQIQGFLASVSGPRR